MSRRVSMEVTVQVRPTGAPASAAVTRTCPDVALTQGGGASDAVCAVTRVTEEVTRAIAALAPEVARAVATAQVGGQEPAQVLAVRREVGLPVEMARLVRGLYDKGEPLTALDLDLLPMGSMVRDERGRLWRQDGNFRLVTSQGPGIESSAWRHMGATGRQEGMAVRRADELALIRRLRLVLVPGLDRPQQESTAPSRGARSRKGRPA